MPRAVRMTCCCLQYWDLPNSNILTILNILCSKQPTLHLATTSMDQGLAPALPRCQASCTHACATLGRHPWSFHVHDIECCVIKSRLQLWNVANESINGSSCTPCSFACSGWFTLGNAPVSWYGISGHDTSLCRLLRFARNAYRGSKFSKKQSIFESEGN